MDEATAKLQDINITVQPPAVLTEDEKKAVDEFRSKVADGLHSSMSC
jgi:hypothetical protein